MSIIAAGTTTTTALSSTGNTDGTLQFQVNGTTASVTLNTLGAVGVGSSPSFGTSGQVLISGGSTVAPAWGAVAVPSGATLTNPTITNYTETTYTANSSTAITLALTNGTMQIITLTGICTVTMPTVEAGKSFLLLLKTGAGGYTVTWTTVKWSGGTAPTLTSTASRMDIFSFFSDGTNWYGVVAGQNYTP
jgi:hypothetical protein